MSGEEKDFRQCRYCGFSVLVKKSILNNPMLKYRFIYCDDCQKLKNILFRNQNSFMCEILDADVYVDYFIKIRYGVMVETHSGTCFAPHDICVLYHNFETSFPLVYQIKKKDFNDNLLNIDNPLLKIYDFEPLHHKNGPCNCYTRYFIEKAELLTLKVNKNKKYLIKKD